MSAHTPWWSDQTPRQALTRLLMRTAEPAPTAEPLPTKAQLAQARLEGAQAVLDAVIAADAALATPWRMVKDAREAAARVGEPQ